VTDVGRWGSLSRNGWRYELGLMEHLYEMPPGVSNGHVTDDVT